MQEADVRWYGAHCVAIMTQLVSCLMFSYTSTSHCIVVFVVPEQAIICLMTRITCSIQELLTLHLGIALHGRCIMYSATNVSVTLAG